MKIASKLVAGVAACALAFGLVGCGGNDGATEEEKEYTSQEISAQDVEITEQGYSMAADGTVNYAFMINNPNDGYVAQNLTFTIEGYSEDDMMLVGGGETVAEVYPGVATAVAGISYASNPDSSIARFEITPLMETVTWEKTDLTAEEIEDMFSVGSTTEERASDDSLVVSASVTTDLNRDGEEASSSAAAASPTDLIEAHAVCILRDASGNIVGGGYSSGFLMDQSMVPNAAPIAEADGETASTEGETSTTTEPGTDTAGSLATTTVTITIAAAPSYATCEMYVFPGM